MACVAVVESVGVSLKVPRKGRFFVTFSPSPQTLDYFKLMLLQWEGKFIEYPGTSPKIELVTICMCFIL